MASELMGVGNADIIEKTIKREGFSMTELKLPVDFETYPEARKAGFMNMKRLKDSGA